MEGRARSRSRAPTSTKSALRAVKTTRGRKATRTASKEEVPSPTLKPSGSTELPLDQPSLTALLLFILLAVSLNSLNISTPITFAPLKQKLAALKRYLFRSKFPTDLPPNVAPWPSFRANCENTGFVPMRTHTKEQPQPAQYWSFQTGRGIFSVPAISSDSHVLIGSADRKFYALDEATGQEIWNTPTGEIIDSAGAIHGSNIIFASGDGHVYNASIATGEIHWKFAAHHQENTKDENEGLTCGEAEFIVANGGTSTWFEGQVQISPIDGRIYIGNDDYRMYSIYANGTEAYSFYPGPLPYGTIWSGPAITRSGSVIGSSMNGKYFKLDKNGKCIWFHEEMNSISSGPAVEADLKLVFIGSWNGVMKGVNHTTGHTVWTFTAADQIYGGAAVDAARRQIYFGSQDGVFYALNSETGKSVWRFRVNYPIRTSPALALDAIYFGAANGMIYALNPANGELIWAFDTTEDPDHREINASPALGHASVIFGSEDGRIISVPYRYCLDERTKNDKRCFRDSASIGVTSDEGRNLYYVYPGGIISRTIPDGFPIEGEFHIRLLIVADNKTRPAHVLSATAELSPATTTLVVDYLSTSGSILITRKEDFLASDTTYNLTVTMFDNSMASTKKTFTFQTAPQIPPAPKAPTVNGDKVTTLHVYNLKPSYPPSWISLNQIGFDSVNLLASTIHVFNKTSYLLWIAAGHLNQDSTITLDPTTPTLAPGVLTMHPNNRTFQLVSQFSLITGGPPIPMTAFTVSSHFDVDGTFGTKGAPSWMSWSSWCGDSISSLIGAIQTNMCSSRGRIVTVGAARGRIYGTVLGERNRNWGVKKVWVKASGWLGTEYLVTAQIGSVKKLGDEEQLPIFGIVLFDDRKQIPVFVDYKAGLKIEKQSEGVVVSLTVPSSSWIGGDEVNSVRVVVMVDMFPAYNGVVTVQH
ncbi:hypothetical protein HDU79_006130 [Rhizoclosmatium sp. JEL0117]|nr:hypothetical protein HDU79_006130 [Rhizoclosmatium sp. JEL0117]